ncbi:MAG: hypothetical protein ACI9ON_002391 [Limisphaerales bacterium]
MIKMKHASASSLVDWIQIVTGVAIIGGLVLVIVELQQSKALTRAQLGSAAVFDSIADHRALMGENPAVTLLTACLHPDQLTDHDRLILRSYFTLHTLKAYRAKGLEDIGGFGADWESGAFYQYEIVSSTEPGQRWLRGMLRTIPDEQLRRVATNALEKTKPSNCRESISN